MTFSRYSSASAEGGLHDWSFIKYIKISGAVILRSQARRYGTPLIPVIVPQYCELWEVHHTIKVPVHDCTSRLRSITRAKSHAETVQDPRQELKRPSTKSNRGCPARQIVIVMSTDEAIKFCFENIVAVRHPLCGLMPRFHGMCVAMVPPCCRSNDGVVQPTNRITPLGDTDVTARLRRTKPERWTYSWDDGSDVRSRDVVVVSFVRSSYYRACGWLSAILCRCCDVLSTFAHASVTDRVHWRVFGLVKSGVEMYIVLFVSCVAC